MVSFSLQQAIQTAIDAEEHGVKFYSEMAKKFAGDENLKNIFEILAKDEIEHKKQFSALLDESSELKEELPEDNIIFLKSCDVSKFFAGMNNPPANPDEILKNAFQFEKESVFYYSGIRDIFGKSEKMDIIIQKEKSHMTQLMKYMLTDTKFRGTEDKF